MGAGEELGREAQGAGRGLGEARVLPQAGCWEGGLGGGLREAGGLGGMGEG